MSMRDGLSCKQMRSGPTTNESQSFIYAYVCKYTLHLAPFPEPCFPIYKLSKFQLDVTVIRWYLFTSKFKLGDVSNSCCITAMLYYIQSCSQTIPAQ